MAKKVTSKAATLARNWPKAFLAALEDFGNVTLAAKAAGVPRQITYETRARDPEFAKQWASALKVAGDLLEAEARRRAYNGVDEPVIHQGQLMGQWVMPDGKVVAAETPGATLIPLTVKKYSDVLLIFLLKGVKPNKFRERAKVEHGIQGQIYHKVAIVPEDEYRRAYADFRRHTVRSDGDGTPPKNDN